MKKNLMLLAVAAIALSSCGGFKKGDGGLLYNIHVDKSGPTIKEGDFVALNLIVKSDADSVMFDTFEQGRPIMTAMPKPQTKGDVFTGIMLLSEGDSATIKINADSIFKKGQPKPPGFKGKFISYNVKVERVISKGKLAEDVFQGRIKEFITSMNDKTKASEAGKITKYIADNNLKVTKTASGVNYVITTPGSGPTPTVGDTVVVDYTGKLVTGKIFDTSDKDAAVKGKVFNPQAPYKPIRFPVGEKKVIPGWDEGLMLLNKGAKATFVIPSSQGYGEQGAGPILPFTPLVFDVTLVDIIHPNPNAPKPVVPAMPQMQSQPVTK